MDSMADSTNINRPLTREQVRKAHTLVKPYIHHTPVLTCQTLSDLASTPQTPQSLLRTPFEGHPPAHPKINLFFKSEHLQKIGAFKARGAFHALSRLTDGELENGVITHSSGNYAQALAFAARTRGVKAYIVMPSISTPSKIAATKGYGAEVVFSGSTSEEREVVLQRVMGETGALFVPPYDHVDVILGQGTLGLEFEEQVKGMEGERRGRVRDCEGWGWRGERERMKLLEGRFPSEGLDAVVAPCGGGGMLSGVCTALEGTGIAVFGAEPEFQGADDLCRGLAQGERIEVVSSLTIADGVRTPVGKIPWTVLSDRTKLRGAYSVTEEQIKSALKLLCERMKVFVEPCAALGLAVVLYNEDFRRLVEREAGEEGWNIGIVLSGGNTTMEALGKLFETKDERLAEREEGVHGMDGEKTAENVAG